MTLADRLTVELHRFGLAGHPLSRILPGIVTAHHRERRSTRRWALVSVWLFGIIIGATGALGIIWSRLDALSGSANTMAAACLNPGKAVVTSKAHAQVIATQVERRKEREP